MHSVGVVLFLVILAVVATFIRRLRVPAPSLLVIAGVMVALLPGAPAVVVTPDAMILVVPPPLLFSAGEELPWRALRVVWRPVTALPVAVAALARWLSLPPRVQAS